MSKETKQLEQQQNIDEIKRAKYRVKNSEGEFEVVYFETSADQVEETADRKFVTAEEKAKIVDTANAIDEETTARTEAVNLLQGRLDVIEGSGTGSIQKALEDAKAYTDQEKATIDSDINALESKVTQAESDISNLKDIVTNSNSNTIVVETEDQITIENPTPKIGDIAFVINSKRAYIYKGVSAVSVRSIPEGWIIFDEITNELDLVDYLKTSDAELTYRKKSEQITISDLAADVTSKFDTIVTEEQVDEKIKVVDDKLVNKADVSHTHTVATQQDAGFMSAEDKKKLDTLNLEDKTVIVDNLNSNASNEALSANQGRILNNMMLMFGSLLEKFSPIDFNVLVCVSLDNTIDLNGTKIIATPVVKTLHQTIEVALENGLTYSKLTLEPGVEYVLSLSKKEGYVSTTVTVSGGTGQMAIRELRYEKHKIYGFEINQKELFDSEDKPEYTVNYIEDAVGMNPITCSDGVVDLGDWGATDLLKNNKPCVVKDGVVQYYLNPNDYSLKENGEPANLDGTDGDVMAEFSKMYYKIEHDTDDKESFWSSTRDIFRFKISSSKIDDSWKCLAFMDATGSKENDKMYISIYNTIVNDENKLESASNKTVETYKISKAREAATNKGSNYQQLTAIKWNYLQMITTLVTKSVNITKIFGVNNISESHITGSGNKLGQFAAASDMVRGSVTKLFHIEDLYACSTIVEGLGNYKTKAFAPYNDDFSDYESKGLSTGGIGNAVITAQQLTVHETMGVVYPQFFMSDYSVTTEGQSAYCGSGLTIGDSYSSSESYATVGGGASKLQGYNLYSINQVSVDSSSTNKTRLTC